MWSGKKDLKLEALKEVFELTLNDKLMWHRHDYYVRRAKYEEMLARISSINDEIEAAQVGASRVGANKNNKYLSTSNLEKLSRFRSEIRDLREEKKRIRRRAMKEKRGVDKSAGKNVKRVRKFCATYGDSMIIVFTKGKTVYADVRRFERERYGYEGRRQSAQFHSSTGMYSDEDFPQLITLMILLQSGDYLVKNELDVPIKLDWVNERLLK